MGAGTSGCVLARELIHSIPNIRILVLEAGGPDANSNEAIMIVVVNVEKIDYSITKFRKLSKEVVKERFHCPRGKVWGGSSSLNSMIYKRVQAKEYNDWAAQGPEYKIWDLYHCLEAFKALENNSREKSDENFKKFHGFNGLLHVQGNLNGNYDVISGLVDVAKNLGIPYNDDLTPTMKDGDSYLKDTLKKVELCPDSESNDFRKVAVICKELLVGRNLMDHPFCPVVAKSIPNTVHYWSSGPEIGIIHKANVEGKIPCNYDFFDENPDLRISGMFLLRQSLF
ncbi:35231_t:CDS:2, partial [Gigaspora margarita]